MEIEEFYKYIKLIGIESIEDLKRFFKEQGAGNEKPITTLKRYVAYLKRWRVVK